MQSEDIFRAHERSGAIRALGRVQRRLADVGRGSPGTEREAWRAAVAIVEEELTELIDPGSDRRRRMERKMKVERYL